MTHDAAKRNGTSSESSLFAQITDPVISIDFEGRVLYWNRGAELLYGLSKEDMIGQSLSNAYRREWLHGENDSSVFEGIRKTGKASGECLQILHDGRKILVEYDGYLLHENDQEVGFMAILRDVSVSRREDLERIAKKERTLERARQQWAHLRTNGTVVESFLENLPVLAYVKDDQGRHLFLNRAAREVITSSSDGTGKTNEEVFTSETATQFRQNDLAALTSGRALQTVETLVCKGEERSFLTVKFPLSDAEGNRFVGGVSIDITGNVREQAELRKQAALLDLASDAIYVAGLEGTITYWNRGAEKLYGWSPSEAIGRNVNRLLRSEFPGAYEELHEELLRTGSCEAQVVHHCKDGNPITVSSRWSLLRDLNGVPTSRLVINTDVTQTQIAFHLLHVVETEAKRKASELAAILDAIPGATFIAHDPDCLTMTSSSAAYKMLRLPPGSNSSKSAPPDERPNFRVIQNGRELAPEELPVQQSAATGKPVLNEEFTLVFEDETSIDIYGNAVPLLDENGRVRGAVGSFIDITERNKTATQLRLSENRYRALVEASAEIVWTTSAHGFDADETNKTSDWQNFTGQTRDEIAGLGWVDPIHPDDRNAVLESWQKGVAKGEPFEMANRLRRRDGVYRHMEVRVSPVRDDFGNIVEWIGMHTDVTAKKSAEEALRHTESIYRSLYNSGTIGIGFPDRFGAIHEANDELLRIVGYSREDLEAGQVRWDTMTPPEYAELDATHIAEAEQLGSCTPYEKEYFRKDGHRVPILCGYAKLARSTDEYIGWVQDLTSLKRVEAELREREQRFSVLTESLPELIWIADPEGQTTYCNRQCLEYLGGLSDSVGGRAWLENVHPDDQRQTEKIWAESVRTGKPYQNEYRLRRHDGVYRCFLARAIPTFDQSGKIDRWLGVSTDIQDQKLVEDALRRSEKLAAAGRLAASIAHEINNPLASVTNVLYLALQDRNLSEATRQYLKLADQELARVAQVTTQTLRFHKQLSPPTSVDVRGIMDSAITLFDQRFRSSSVTVVREYQSLHKLFCHSDELRQVFTHVLSNSNDSMPQGGKLRVRIREARAWDEARTCGIRVVIADTGCGIPADMRKSVFEAFVSTKDPTGTGLGLWVSEGIVQKHNGRIALRSRTDSHVHGTVISLFFPFVGASE